MRRTSRAPVRVPSDADRLPSTARGYRRLDQLDDPALVEHIRDLERQVRELAPAAAILQGDVPCFVVDANWAELRELNEAAQHLFRLALPATASDLLARIDQRDHTAIGMVTTRGGHLPMVQVRRPDGETRLVACTAVPRRAASGAVLETAFLASDVTDQVGDARDVDLAAHLAAAGLYARPDALWQVIAREVRRGCRATSVTILERDDHVRALAVDPPDAVVPSVVEHLPRSLSEPALFTPSLFALQAGATARKVVLVVDGAVAAEPLLGDDTTTRRVLDGLVDRHRIDAERIDRLSAAESGLEALRDIEIERDAAREAAAIAQAARAHAEALAESTAAELADVSHELRNSLNSVCGFAQVLARQPLDDQPARAVQHILLAGRHLSSLLDRVLELARIDHGPAPRDPEPLDLARVVDETFALVQASAAARRVRLDAQLDAVAPSGDAGAVRQVLLNLVSNALTYGREGGNVVVSAHAAGPVVRIEVTDDGAGIADERQRTLFERFDRGGRDSNGNGDTAGGRGTGLGLALCRRLVESMDGSIGVHSRLGVGSTFWFELPVARDTMGAVVHTVVVAVPDEPTLELVDLALHTLPGVQVRPLRSARSAADVVRRLRPSVLVVDVDLADADALVTATRVTSPSTRVVTLTAAAHASGLAGVRVELRKPCSVDDLLEVVADQLEEL